MPKEILLITGASGQLGSELKTWSATFPEHTYYFTGIEELDIADPRAVQNYIKNKGVTLVLNCAAHTAVDGSEREPRLADLINHIAVAHLAQAAKVNGAGLVHISTDYVFDGKSSEPYAVNDPTNPINTYGLTKLKGEQAIKQACLKKAAIIRTSWLYSTHGYNFVKNMIRLGAERDELKVICDQVGSPTYARDLALFMLKDLIPKIKTGTHTYHYTNEGVCSWYDFAKEIMALSKLNCMITPVGSSEYKTAARRPFYSVMNKDLLKSDFNVSIPYWKDSLHNCINILKP